MGILKRFNREQLTLGAAALLSVLLFGWQLARGGAEGATGELPKNDRVYAIGRQSAIEFLDPNVQRYMPGRDIWEPPATGRLPIPEIKPPEPKLGQMTLPPLAPRPDDAEFMMASLPGKFRWIAAAAQTAAPAGFPPDAEIAALKALPETDSGAIVDRRKQQMRSDGLWIVHRTENRPPIKGSVVLDTDQTGDGSIKLKQIVEKSETGITIPASEIDKNKAGTEDGIERGWEYGREYARRAKKLKPDDAEGHRKLGEWCRSTAGMLPEARSELMAAVEALEKRGEVGPPMTTAVQSLVGVLRDFGNYDEAIAASQKCIDAVKGTNNESAKLHLDLGKLYENLGYHERALISFDAAFSLEPGQPLPRIALARARLNLGETKLALNEIDALLAGGGPGHPEAHVVQGLARLRRGQADQAEESFKKALESKPENPAEALNGLGVALALQGKPGAAGNFLAAIKADQYLIDAWLNLAILYVSEGRPVEAEILFSGAAQRDPASSTAAAGAGFLAVLRGQPGEAVAAFERARKIQPDDYFMSYALGRIKLREGKAKEALDLFRAGLKTNPDYLPATTDAALAYLMLARGEPNAAAAESYRVNAQTLLETAFRADPTSNAANAALGCVYAVLGRVREANAAFDRAVKVMVADPLIDYGRGYVEYWYGAATPKERLDLAEVRFKFGAQHPDLKDPADKEWQAECLRAIQSIEDWRIQRVLVWERFDSNQPSPPSWILIQLGTNPIVRYTNDRANLGDDAGVSPAQSYVAIENRDTPQPQFLSVEGTMIFDASQGYEAGFSFYTGALKGSPASAHSLHFVFFEDPASPSPKPILLFHGQQTAATSKGPNRPNLRLGVLPAAPSRVRFKLERKESAEPKVWQFDFSIWDESKSAWKLMNTPNQIKVSNALCDSPTILMQFWARTVTQGRKWAVGVDDVRVLVVEK
ncbi:MAG TPA: tetratricopeptide repeat protein [Planctomycetota bacterium]|nr:tetratricopeptide repeat protein [Planctomycetota bacterium]